MTTKKSVMVSTDVNSTIFNGAALLQPVFVVGCDRSGTTLLSVLIDQHPLFAGTPETNFLHHLRHRALRPPTGATRDSMVDELLGLQHSIDLGLDRDALARRFARYEMTYADLIAAALEEYAQARNCQRVVEKTPIHLEYVPRIMAWFPQAKVVCTIRDGRDNVLSLIRAGWTHGNVTLHSLRWRRFARMAVRFQRRFPDRFLVTRHEDLLRDPVAKLQQLGAWLGFEPIPAQLVGGADSNVVASWETGWKQQAMGPLDPSKIGAWQNTVSNDQRWTMNALMGTMLRHFDYPSTRLDDCPPLKRLRYRARSLLLSVAISEWPRLLYRRVRSTFPSLPISPGRNDPSWSVESLRNQASTEGNVNESVSQNKH